MGEQTEVSCFTFFLLGKSLVLRLLKGGDCTRMWAPGGVDPGGHVMCCLSQFVTWGISSSRDGRTTWVYQAVGILSLSSRWGIHLVHWLIFHVFS